MGPISTTAIFLAVFTSANPFDPTALNSRENEISIAFSADLRELWLERRAGNWGDSGPVSRLLYAHRQGEGWSPPAPVAFASPDHDEGDPFFDDATQTLYFSSDRPAPGLPAGDANLWRVRRADGAWEEPEPLPIPINAPGREYSPVVRGNRIYFAAHRDGDGTLFRAEPDAGGQWLVDPLGPALNSPSGEWNLWVSADKSWAVFEASGRPTNVSVSGDLYGSARDHEGRWLPAVALTELNGSGSDLNPTMIGDRLIYASTSPHPSHADLYAAPSSLLADELARHYGYRLVMANRSSHTLGSIDIRSGQAGPSRPAGRGPHLVAVRDGHLAVAGYGVYPRPHQEPVGQMPGWVEEDGGELLLVDPAGEARRTQLRCNRPHGSAWDDQARRLWVTCEDRLGVIEIDYRNGPPRYRLIETGRPGAHVAAWDGARDQLLVAHTAAGGVAFIDPKPGDVAFIDLPSGSEALWIDGDRNTAWVTLGPSGRLAVLDLESRKRIATVDPDCSFPIDFATGFDGSLWVACFGSSSVLRLDPATRKPVDRLELPAGPLNVVAHPSLPVLYASLPRQNRVVEISLTGRGVTRSFSTGMEPDGLAIVPVQ